jgi:hypothetical protein
MTLDEEIARRTGVSLDAVAAVLDEALVNQLQRFRCGSVYTFDDPNEEILYALSAASGESIETVAMVLKAIGDVAMDWTPDEIVEGVA